MKAHYLHQLLEKYLLKDFSHGLMGVLWREKEEYCTFGGEIDKSWYILLQITGAVRGARFWSP